MIYITHGQEYSDILILILNCYTKEQMRCLSHFWLREWIMWYSGLYYFLNYTALSMSLLVAHGDYTKLIHVLFFLKDWSEKAHILSIAMSLNIFYFILSNLICCELFLFMNLYKFYIK